MVFDFDACEYTNLIKTSIQALTFTDELNSIIDRYLNPVMSRASFFPESFTNNIKAAIVSTAGDKVNEVKTAVILSLDSLFGNCESRRLSESIDVEQDGSQRILQGGLTFSDLAQSIEVINGVVRFFLSWLL